VEEVSTKIARNRPKSSHGQRLVIPSLEGACDDGIPAPTVPTSTILPRASTQKNTPLAVSPPHRFRTSSRSSSRGKHTPEPADYASQRRMHSWDSRSDRSDSDGSLSDSHSIDSFDLLPSDRKFKLQGAPPPHPLMNSFRNVRQSNNIKLTS
jgi:hypothetical protein